ncbi:MAG: glutamine--fructose-6-phosphate transaminase (isomerizing) [Myxococcaceae bacterium]|nr:glutamine--fructose-6-phosphate transaminase (isomerizing) [Myxococcaceae bacterium]MBH2006351.1 glutamine--fructose-6-phosphate transaminase (isomerizing) [Myxococcaceae bacterium]
MCGIVGYIGNQPAEGILIEGLRRLEYRGYDSAGIATLWNHQTHIQKAVGKLSALSQVLKDSPVPGQIGIAHTRWASHGKPNEVNAHPHRFGSITLVHNGIIENHAKLRKELQNQGHVFLSDTDTEIIAHLIAQHQKKHPKDFPLAVSRALKLIEGAYALAIIDEEHPDTIIGVRQACPLVIGLGENENFLASDFPAALSHTRHFIVLDDGDMAIVRADSVQITDLNGVPQTRNPIKLDWSPAAAEKGGYKHFMLKEIFEQPQAVIDTLRGRFSEGELNLALDGIRTEDLASVNQITIVACGTSFHAGLIAKRYFEELAKIPVEVDLASEFRYRNPLIQPGSLVLGISQSGETADTLAALQLAKSRGARIMALCNVMDSAIARLSNASTGTFYTRAGPEISVASTKALLTQIISLYLLALLMAQQRHALSTQEIHEHLEQIFTLPMLLESALKQEPQIKETARSLVNSNHMLLMGRGLLYPTVLEGALKIKELSYIHAEGYAAGEMKHGPIALIDDKMPVLVLAVQGMNYEKTLSNLEEVKSRGARVLVLCNENDLELRADYPDALIIPPSPHYLVPALAILPLQLLAYHLAVLRGQDVDQPRNLAKSVTIE